MLLGFSLVAVHSFSLRLLLLFRAQALGTGAQWLWLLGSRTQAQQMWHKGLIASRHAGSSQIRDQTYVPSLAGRFFTIEPPGKPLEANF